MNADVIMQIVRDSELIPDENWGCTGGFVCRRIDDEYRINPIGQHVLMHPGIECKLGVTRGSYHSPNGREPMEAIRIEKPRLKEYLDLTYEELEYLFDWPNCSRKDFTD